MIKPGKSSKGQRQGILAALLAVPVIAWQVYLIWISELIRSVGASPSFLLFFALVGTLVSAWSTVDLEYFPKSTGLGQGTRVWFIVGADLWSAGLILLWLEPRLAALIVIFFFVLADLLLFQAARSLLHRGLFGARS